MAGYGTNEGFTAYATASGYVLPDGTTDPQIAAARQRGALVIDRYEPHFSGRRAGGFAQDWAWPRSGAVTQWGEAIGEGDIIPSAVVNGSYEAAFLELTNPGSLSPVVTGSSQVKREKVGQIEVEYAASFRPAQPTSLRWPLRSSRPLRGCCGRS
jgi:hypothetical protein